MLGRWDGGPACAEAIEAESVKLVATIARSVLNLRNIDADDVTEVAVRSRYIIRLTSELGCVDTAVRLPHVFSMIRLLRGGWLGQNLFRTYSDFAVANG